MANQVSYGMTGSSVANLQKQLNQAGYKLSVDGVFGPQTLNAVKQFQQSHGLSVDGIAGNQTFGALSKSSAPRPAPNPTPASAQPQPQQVQPQQAQPTIQQQQQEITNSNGDWLNQFQQGMNNQTQSILDAYQRASQSTLSAQLAQLAQARDSQIAQLEKNYSDAVQQGKIDQNQAQTDFQTQAQQINQQAYQAAEATKLAAQQRGIQNSNEMLGLMQGDQARTMTLNNQNQTQRDQRIADIKSRIDNLLAQKNLDVGQANANYNYTAASATAQSQAAYNQKVADTQMANLQQFLQEQVSLHNMDIQQANDLLKMAQQQQYTQSNMGLQQKYDLAKMSQQENYTKQNMVIQQNYDLAKMAKQHGYDLDTMAKQNAFDLQKLAVQASYSSSAEAQRHKDAISEQAQQLAQQQAINDMEYKQSLARAQAQFTPGTPEYNLAMNKINFDKKQADSQAKQTALMNTLGAIYKANPPKNPGPKPAPQTVHGAKVYTNVQNWQTAENKYQAYQRYLNGKVSASDVAIAQK